MLGRRSFYGVRAVQLIWAVTGAASVVTNTAAKSLRMPIRYTEIFASFGRTRYGKILRNAGEASEFSSDF